MNGLAQITIDGQPVVLKFGLPALRQIVRKYAMVEMTVGDDYSELGVAHILYAGYLNGCAMKDTIPVLSFEKFYEFVEGVEDVTVMQEIISSMRSFEESKAVREHLGEKKKVMEMTRPSIGTK